LKTGKELDPNRDMLVEPTLKVIGSRTKEKFSQYRKFQIN